MTPEDRPPGPEYYRREADAGFRRRVAQEWWDASPQRRFLLGITILASVLILAGLAHWMGLFDRSAVDQHESDPAASRAEPIAVYGHSSSRVEPTGPAPERMVLIRTPSSTRIGLPRASSIPAEIGILLAKWRNSVLQGDLETQVSCYAQEVGPFFTKTSVDLAAVRFEKRRMMSMYPEVRKYDLSQIALETLTESRATVTLRKDWEMHGRKRFAGAERQRLTLARADGAWKIQGEQELKVYWVKRS